MPAHSPVLLVMNSLSAQHGSSVRIQLMVEHLKNHFSQTTLLPYIPSPLKALFAYSFQAVFSTYDILLVQKFNPITLSSMVFARMRGKLVWADWDDMDDDMQQNRMFKYLIRFCQYLGPKWAHTVSSHSHQILSHVPKHKRYFLPQTLDDSFLSYAKPKQVPCFIKQTFNIPQNTLLVTYMCSFTHGGILDLHHVLDVWQEMLLSQKNLHFIIIGGGPKHADVVQLTHQKSLSKQVSISDYLPHQDIPVWLKQMDLAHIYLSDRPANLSRVSLKLCEYLSASVPVIGNVLGENKKQFQDFMHPCNKQDMAKQSLAFLKNPKNLEPVKPFSWPSCSKVMAEFAENIKSAYVSFYG